MHSRRPLRANVEAARSDYDEVPPLIDEDSIDDSGTPRPKYFVDDFLFELAEKMGEPPPERWQSTFPMGTVLEPHDGSFQVELVRFVPGDRKDAPAGGGRGRPRRAEPQLDSYLVRYLDWDETGMLECYDIHDKAAYRRLGRTSETCSICGAEERRGGGTLMTCAACRGPLYCSANCQRENWIEHRPECLKARGNSVERRYIDEADEAKRVHVAREEAAALGELASLDIGEGAAKVLYCTGLGIIDKEWVERIKAFAPAALAAEEVDICTETGCGRAAMLLAESRVSVLVILGLGANGGGVASTALSHAGFRGAAKKHVSFGGRVVIQDEGQTAVTVMRDWFEQRWFNYAGYTRLSYECVVGDSSA